MFGHKDIWQALGRWEKTSQTSKNLEKYLNIFSNFGLNAHISLILDKPDKRNWDITYQCLIPSLSLQPQWQSRGICSPPEPQHSYSFPGAPPATWAGSAVAWMVHIFQSQFNLIINYFLLMCTWNLLRHWALFIGQTTCFILSVVQKPFSLERDISLSLWVITCINLHLFWIWGFSAWEEPGDLGFTLGRDIGDTRFSVFEVYFQ